MFSYIVDISFFSSNVGVSPALTIIANALRVGDRLIERLSSWNFYLIIHARSVIIGLKTSTNHKSE